ncbi:hypothetical protein T484DRAFT_1624159 [Baffinella frigidus]|nr:hypothetical protein T484DRAFT_1624159 [Cryptophyta sp. CCMP2293]
MEDGVHQLLTIWVPGLGAILSILLALAPMKAVLQCRRNKSLGEMNPDVFPLLFGDSVGWLVYAGCTRDVYLYFSVCFRIMAGIFYVLTAYMLVESDAARIRRKIEVVMITMLGLWSAVGFAAPHIADEELRNNVVGSVATMCSLLLFFSPLSTMYKVVRVKSAASISLPFAIMQVLSCGLWSTYGLVIGSIYLAAPNLLAAALVSLQTLNPKP